MTVTSLFAPDEVPPLRVWKNSTTDWVVAYTAADAADLMLKQYLGDFPCANPEEFNLDFEAEPDDKMLLIVDESHYTKRRAPRRRRMKCSTWAKKHGRGFLCSTEY